MFKYINPLLVLSFWFFTPSLFVFFGLADSFAPGVGFVVLFLSVLILIFNFDLIRVTVNDIIFYLFVFFLVFLHLTVLAFDSTLYWKGVFSLVFFVYLLVFSKVIKNIIDKIDDKKFHRLFICFFVVLCLVGILPLVGLRVVSSFSSYKSVFPFLEPSHYALTFTPFLVYAVASAGKWQRMLIFFFALLLALALENLTLMVVVFILAVVFFMNYKIIFFVPVALGIFFYFDLSYFTDRLNFSDTSNLSALVYIQGWEFMSNSFLQKYGMGVAFQQLGSTDLFSSAADKIYEILGFNMNLNDGGFTAAKIFSEFGIFSIFIFYPLVKLIGKSYFSLRKFSFTNNFYNCKYIAAQSFLIGSLVELLVRGIGYFTPTLIAVLISILFVKEKDKSIGK